MDMIMVDTQKSGPCTEARNEVNHQILNWKPHTNRHEALDILPYGLYFRWTWSQYMRPLTIDQWAEAETRKQFRRLLIFILYLLLYRGLYDDNQDQDAMSFEWHGLMATYSMWDVYNGLTGSQFVVCHLVIDCVPNLIENPPPPLLLNCWLFSILAALCTIKLEMDWIKLPAAQLSRRLLARVQ